MNRDADPETAFAINMVRMCQAMHCLPEQGGLFDQDSYFVYLLGLVMEADHEKAELDKRRGKA